MSESKKPKRRNFPIVSLEKSLGIIKAIVEKGAGKPMEKSLVAQAVGSGHSSKPFFCLLRASRFYGLTKGTEKADYIEPTPLGLKIGKPERPQDVQEGHIEACLAPSVYGAVYRTFNDSKLPEVGFLKNSLEKQHGVPAKDSEKVAQLVWENARFCGILKEDDGGSYIRIPNTSQAPADGETSPGTPESGESISESSDKLDSQEAQTAKRPEKRLFIAHGKNTEPLAGLKEILDSLKVNYRVAEDEPHAGRPISVKVADLMRECTGGVFIFTRDERFFREGKKGGEEVWRPSENVIYELGAASVLWGRNIIILKEEGVSFPSDFSDLGYISFEGETIDMFPLFKELVKLGYSMG